jgi:ferredoxin
MAETSAALVGLGVDATQIRTEFFGPAPAITPGVIPTPTRPPHHPEGEATDGPRVGFARSGLTVHWDPRYASLLDLAEACDVPTRWSCRTGVCHTCETSLLSGRIGYAPDPVDNPADGNVLICCSQPVEDTVLDM